MNCLQKIQYMYMYIQIYNNLFKEYICTVILSFASPHFYQPYYHLRFIIFYYLSTTNNYELVIIFLELKTLSKSWIRRKTKAKRKRKIELNVSTFFVKLFLLFNFVLWNVYMNVFSLLLYAIFLLMVLVTQFSPFSDMPLFYSV